MATHQSYRICMAVLCLLFLPITALNASSEPYGLDAMAQFGRVCHLKGDVRAGQASSYDRSGGNSDGFGASNFLYIDSYGDKVMLDINGPGCLYNMWFTGFNWDNAIIKIYFDNETTPTVNRPLRELFEGDNDPFLAPLVGGWYASSGGYYCYVPMPFSSGLKITTNGAGDSFFYHFGYHRFPPGAPVTTWTGDEDSQTVRDMWNRAQLGADPKTTAGGFVSGNTIDVAAGQTQTLLDTTGPGVTNAIKIRIPGVATPRTGTINLTDDGRAFIGYSQFQVNIAADNQQVKLVRRLDYGIADQKANVYVNDAYVGQWFDAGSDGGCHWRDSEFLLPPASTAGLSSITVKIEFVSSGFDWNEFYYFIHSQRSGVWEQTDTIDIANTASETAHAYTISEASWYGTRTFCYPPTMAAQATDTGRHHSGTSSFRLTTLTTNQGVILKRRLDYSIADQKAYIYVDGFYVGQWHTPGITDTTDDWIDSLYYIPTSYTVGKTHIDVDVVNATSGGDWTEFTYWCYSITGNGREESDVLNVGNSTSETSHNYAVSNATWSGAKTATYPVLSADGETLLQNLWLRIYWDGDVTPSVEAPIGAFFGLGYYTEAFAMRSLPMGIDPMNNLYMYFPMPYRGRARITLTNALATAADDITYEIGQGAFEGSFAKAGYFKTAWTTETPSTAGRDLLLLDTNGSGHLVGVVESVRGPSTRYNLEGDERIYVDGSKTPAFYGTGTEDFYQGGWYFGNGPFSLPLHGNNTHYADASYDYTTMYRLMPHDCIPFRTGIHAGIEHGATNDVEVHAYNLAWYYQHSDDWAQLTDTLNVGNSSHEAEHDYGINQQTSSGWQWFNYEGDNDTVSIGDNGRSFTGYSIFNMSIDPQNNGVLLRRRCDQQTGRSRATVIVDDETVGDWYSADQNTYDRWRDEEFIIPEAYTAGKDTIRIKLQYVSSPAAWNEYYYWCYSLYNDETIKFNWLISIAENWLETPSPFGPADLNGDGDVNFLDFAILCYE